MKKLRIGFVGVGFMGQVAHLRNYVNLPDCEVAAIAEVMPRRARLVAERYGVPKVYADHREMLAAERLDGIVSSQPFTRHVHLLPDLYKGVKFLFTEKALAVMPEAGNKLVKQAAAAGCTHMVGYHKRSDPAVMYARKVIDQWKKSGEMGRFKYVRITMPAGDWVANGGLGFLNAEEKAPELQWESKPAKMEQATWDRLVGFVNYYIHQVNMMRHILGEKYDLAYVEDSDTMLAVRSESGVAGVIEMSPYQTSIEWEEVLLACFERGYVKVRLPAPLACNRAGVVELYKDPGSGKTPERTIPTLPWIHAMRQQAMNFLDVIRGKIDPPCDAAEAAEDLRIARAFVKMRYKA